MSSANESSLFERDEARTRALSFVVAAKSSFFSMVRAAQHENLDAYEYHSAQLLRHLGEADRELIYHGEVQ